MTRNGSMDMAVKVSVIIPTWNRPDLLQQCVASLAGQSWPSYEVVVIDDASPVDPAPLFRDMPHVRVLRNPQNCGQAYARNHGIEKSDGAIVIFLDDDCRVEDPLWIERHVKAHTDQPDRLVGGRIVNIATSFAGRARSSLTRQGIQFGGFLQTMNLSLTRESLDHIGPFDRTLRELEDVDFSMRALKAGKQLIYRDDLVVFHHYRDAFRGIMKRSFQYGCWTIPVRKLRRLSGHWALPGNLALSVLYWIPLSMVSATAQILPGLKRHPGHIIFFPWIFCYCLAHSAGFIAFYWRQWRMRSGTE